MRFIVAASLYGIPFERLMKPFLLLCLCLMPVVAFGADINLSFTQEAVGREVTITVENDSPQAVNFQRVTAELNGQIKESREHLSIPENESRVFKITFDKLPEIPGSYPLIVRVYYFNEGMVFSLIDVGVFNHGASRILPANAEIQEEYIVNEGDLVLGADYPSEWRLIIPDEISILNDSIQEENYRVFRLRGNNRGFNNQYDVFAITEKVIRGTHHMAFIKGRLGMNYQLGYPRGRIPDIALLILTGLSFLGAFYLVALKPSESRALTALGKYAVRMFFLTSAYYFLRHGSDYFGQLAIWIEIEWMRTYIFVPFSSHLAGREYRYFFGSFIDYYWALCALICFPYSYFFDSEKTLKADKYSAFFHFVVTYPRRIYLRFNPPPAPVEPESNKKKKKRKKKPAPIERISLRWDWLSKLGFLTLCVKLFYIPLLSNWVINNVHHQINLTRSLEWTLYQVNAYFLALFIFVDTLIFGFGYIVESKFLKNEIRSVEPTIIGWVVCLWCYPPFNYYSFHIFDHQLFDTALDNVPSWLNTTSLIAITVGWGIFAWASVALGFKASNLTNRGIVSKGPYRFCRHPAYTVKIMVWILEGVFFGKYFAGLMFGFAFIYFLRAWTEERHLSKDPDYLEYKKKVPYMFIPKVI